MTKSKSPTYKCGKSSLTYDRKCWLETGCVPPAGKNPKDFCKFPEKRSHRGTSPRRASPVARAARASPVAKRASPVAKRASSPRAARGKGKSPSRSEESPAHVLARRIFIAVHAFNRLTPAQKEMERADFLNDLHVHADTYHTEALRKMQKSARQSPKQQAAAAALTSEDLAFEEEAEKALMNYIQQSDAPKAKKTNVKRS